MPELSDMPELVKEEIVKKLDMFDRISLAKTSRSFHAFVEDQKLFHRVLKLESRLGVTFLDSSASFSNWLRITYHGKEYGCLKSFKCSEKRILGVSEWKQALLDLNSILKNPKLHLNTLEIGFNVPNSEPSESLENPINVLEDSFKFTHYLNVKKLRVIEYSPDQFLKTLPTLKPGYLETIDIFSPNRNVDSMNTVFQMKQWKQAKRFDMDGGRFIWPLHHLYHFEDFTVILKQLSVEDIRQMKKVLFASPNFEKCSILGYDNTSANTIKEEFGDYLLKGADTSELKQTYHYPISNSAGYFEIRVEGHRFEVARKK